MTIASPRHRRLGTMVAYGFADRAFERELELARLIGAQTLEIFPDWRALPDPRALRQRVGSSEFTIHSAHGCWAGQSIEADRVDLSHGDGQVRSASLRDLKRCVDWLAEAGGSCLVVHPGGLSDRTEFSARRAALAEGLAALADHARGTGVAVCVENMPPGVWPGSKMDDLFQLLTELDRPELRLTLDTGHAHIASELIAETLAAGALLGTTHVHDNNGRQDAHLPPGLGTIDWSGWAGALDRIGYDGPVMLECIRHFRNHPESLTDELHALLGALTVRG